MGVECIRMNVIHKQVTCKSTIRWQAQELPSENDLLNVAAKDRAEIAQDHAIRALHF